MSPLSVPGKMVLGKDFVPQSFMYANPDTFGLWTPSQLTTALWLDAADSSTVTVSSGVVNQWSDKSGNANNATRTTGDPSYLTAAQNGFNTVRFYNASPTRMTFTRLTSLGHVFFVAKKEDVDDRGIVMRDSTYNDFRGVVLGQGAGSNLYVQQYSHVNSGATRNAWHIAEIETNGTTATLGVDATRVSASNTNLMFTSELGYYHVLVSQYAFQGEIGEVVISQTVLNATDRQKMEGYLAHKWGLTGNLPSDHPYKLVPPIS